MRSAVARIVAGADIFAPGGGARAQFSVPAQQTAKPDPAVPFLIAYRQTSAVTRKTIIDWLRDQH
jgi:hypothetical protein